MLLLPLSVGQVIGVVLAVVLGLIALAAWIWLIVNVIRRPDLSGGAKAAWIIFALIFPLLTVIVYLIVGRAGRR